MRTDAIAPASAAKFAIRCASWSAGLIGLSRFGLLEFHVITPLTHVEGSVAVALFGAPAAPIAVTSACSGADAFALCLAAIMAYPARWRSRLSGVVGGAAVLLALNITRIGTLGRAAGSNWFDVLHLYIWPAVLVIVAAAYVFTWTGLVNNRSSWSGAGSTWLPGRFVLFAVVLLMAFLAAAPFYLHSTFVGLAASVITLAAAGLLNAVGLYAQADGSTLSVSAGRFVVTQECLMTPLIPLYLAAACTYSQTRWGQLAAIAATLPLFVALGFIRVLVVALPSPQGLPATFLVHSFFQLLLGAMLICLAAQWRRRDASPLTHAAVGLAFGASFLALLGPLLTRTAIHVEPPLMVDLQGALTFLPVFQFGLYLSLWIAAFTPIGWRRCAAGLCLLAACQVVGLLVLNTLAEHAGFFLHVRNVRAWAIAGPVLALAAVVPRVSSRR